MESYPPCPQCASLYVYVDGPLLICPECAHEWSLTEPLAEFTEPEFRDSVGNILQDGDDVIVTKTMKVKGAPGPLKAGTKVRNIRLVEGDHDIDCTVPGFGKMMLKTSIVKKA